MCMYQGCWSYLYQNPSLVIIITSSVTARNYYKLLYGPPRNRFTDSENVNVPSKPVIYTKQCIYIQVPITERQEGVQLAIYSAPCFPWHTTKRFLNKLTDSP